MLHKTDPYVFLSMLTKAANIVTSILSDFLHVYLDRWIIICKLGGGTIKLESYKISNMSSYA